MVKSKTYQIEGPNGSIRVVHVKPTGPLKAPGVVLLHEAFGLNTYFLELGQRLAREGYEVFLPDLYTRQPGIYAFRDEDVVTAHGLTLGPDRVLRFEALPAETRKRLKPAIAWFEQRDSAGFHTDALAAARWARGKLAGRPLAAWGFCLGGGVVGELAAEVGAVDAGVIFYGRIPAVYRAEAIRIPLEGHFAETDPNITPHVLGFANILRRNEMDFRARIHPGTRHGFFNATRPAFNPKAAAAAWGDTLDFLRRRLGPGVHDARPGGRVRSSARVARTAKASVPVAAPAPAGRPAARAKAAA